VPELPSGTVTFLFTDLEGSTRLWEQHPEAMQGALARHDAILRDAIELHEGCVVKTTGDGVHAVFGDAFDAARAAVDAQLGLAEEPWPKTGPLRVRMGVHSGLAEQRDGDYYGPALNRAARLMSVAHGGQIALSLVTGELLRDRAGDEFELVDLGEHRLRDLDRPERVYQLAHPRLQRDFPTLTSVDSSPGNLPAQVTSFVGREHDVDHVSDLVEQHRLVTLIGVGGVGKTRLALQIAEGLAPQFADGAWLVDLAAAPDDESVPLAIATALAAPLSTGTVSAESVATYLSDREILVVLDNCEHVIDAVGELADLVVQRCRDARLLATSREGLAVAGEHLWPVRPLGLDVEGTDATAWAPVRLFADRVQAIRPDFEIDSTNVEPVVEICRRLDGLPLAIELAAARARSLTLREISTRLDERFSLLSGGKRRGVARHETLRAAVDWSYDLLDDDERVVLARVAVCAGGFTLDAAERIVVPEAAADDILDVLDRLVDKSLLVADSSRDVTRYRLLETIRQYALEKLNQSSAMADVRDRHLDHMAVFAGTASAGLLGPDENMWHVRTEDELDNLRAAVAWAAETGNAPAALALATAFSGQAYMRYTWGLETLATVAAEIPGASDDRRYPLAIAMTAIRKATEGLYDEAEARGAQALALATEDIPEHWEARAKAELMLGDLSLRGDSRSDPVAHYERALECSAGTLVASTPVMARHLLAVALPNRGREALGAARVEADRVMDQALATGSPTMIAQAHFGLGYIEFLTREPGAEQHLRKSLGSFGPNAGGALGVLALVLSAEDNSTEALDTLGEAVRLSRDSGDHSMVSVNLDLGLPLLLRAGDAAGAATLLGALEHGAVPHVQRTGVPGQRRTRTTDRIVEQLGTSEFNSLRAQGAAMDYATVVAFALERINAARDTNTQTQASAE
jgi:predicted ATPase/class 3 adenylate cyclase